METSSQSRLTVFLLAVIAAAAVVIAAVLIGPRVGGDGESTARQAARHHATEQATETCTLSLDANVRDDVYNGCIKRQVAEIMAAWDADHPSG